MRRRLFLFALAVGLSMLTACASAPAGVLVIPLNPDGKHAGRTYDEWAAEWWKWAFSLPATNHPLLDTTGADAARGQSGSVWFLGGTFGDPSSVSRSITVPGGTAFFFPLYNFEEDSVFAPDSTAAEMADSLRIKLTNVTSINLKVDGQALPDLTLLRGTSPGAFSVTLPPADDLYSFFGVDGVTPGMTVETMVADGYWAFIDPLPAGVHTIEFGGTENGPDGVFSIQANYTIRVLE